MYNCDTTREVKARGLTLMWNYNDNMKIIDGNKNYVDAYITLIDNIVDCKHVYMCILIRT